MATVRDRTAGPWPPFEKVLEAWLTRSSGFDRSIDHDDPNGRAESATAHYVEPTEPIEQELGDFVSAHYQRLIRLAVLVCRNTEDAEDAVQAAFERAWRSKGALRDRRRLKPWLDRIVVREAIRISRSRTGFLRRLFGSEGDDLAAEVADPRAGVETGWTDMRAAFARLSAEQRAVVVFHLYAGYSVAETADLVGVGVETARSRLRLARARLRATLGEA